MTALWIGLITLLVLCCALQWQIDKLEKRIDRLEQREERSNTP